MNKIWDPVEAGAGGGTLQYAGMAAALEDVPNLADNTHAHA
jgi:hypothetical protein